MDGWVTPERRRRGIGRALLHWTERRAREAAAESAGRRAACPRHVDRRQEPRRDRPVRGRGLRAGPVRLHDGPRPDRADPRSRRCPTASRSGRSSKPTTAGSGTPTSRRSAITGATANATTRTSRWFAIPEIDTALWQIAWDGDEVAGSVMAVRLPEGERGAGHPARMAGAHQRASTVATSGTRVGADRRVARDARERGLSRRPSAWMPRTSRGAAGLRVDRLPPPPDRGVVSQGSHRRLTPPRGGRARPRDRPGPSGQRRRRRPGR